MRQPEKEYAAALFMLAVEEQCTETYQRALHTVRDAVADVPEWLDFLDSPAIPLSERLTAIDEAFAAVVPVSVLSFLKLLCEGGYSRLLPMCIAEYDTLAQTFSNRTVAAITSAVPLSDAQKNALCRKLETMIGKGVDPRYAVDPALIGGLVIEVDNKTYDGSLRHRLHDVKDVMLT